MSEDRQEINVRMPRTLYLALRDEAHVSFRSMNEIVVGAIQGLPEIAERMSKEGQS